MSRSHRRAGFTLIELAIGLGIAAMVTAMAVMGINAVTDANLRSTAIELTGAVKMSYDRAIMQKRTQRLAIDLDKGLWWMEFTEAPFALSSELMEGEKGESLSAGEDEGEKKDTFFDDEEAEKEQVRRLMEGHARSFLPDADTELGTPRPLPGGIAFTRVWTSHQEEPFTAGMAYLHFFKNGQSEAAIIELTDEGEDVISLEVQPLTGRVASHHKRLEIPDVDEADGREDGDE